MRKAQGGMNAAALVAIISGLIILYIVFLPASEREALLENKSTTSTSNGGDSDIEDVLLREYPGRMDTAQGVLDKTIPNIFLFEKTDAEELEIINPFMVRNGVFDKKNKIVSFGIDDLDNTDNILLSFKAKTHEGVLTIKLNNEIVYENDIESETVAPIRLKKSPLTSQNTLEFSVSSVGWKFWKTNEYSLDEIKIVGDITDLSKQESRNIVTLTETELFNIESANLRFVPYCNNVADVGVLDISVNSKQIFSAVPICDDAYKQTVPVGILNVGENRIIFKTNKGSYSVEQIKIEFVEKETRTDVYYFEVNQSVINYIRYGEADVVLEMTFVDDRRNKRADINVNDIAPTIRLDDDGSIFTKKLNYGNDPDLLVEGNNFIEIEPRTTLDIVELKVEVRER